MSNKAQLLPSIAWDFYLENDKRLEDELVQIAKSTSGFYEIYMTVDDGSPCIEVYERDKDVPICTEYFVSASDAEATVKRFYDKYFVEYDDTEEEEDEDTSERDEKICEREHELMGALKGFIDVVTDGDQKFSEIFEEADAADTLDYILEHLAYDMGVVVYRPAIIVTDDEDEKYTEYPYEEYDMR